MSRLTPAGWWWKPVTAVALAALMATWADAAPPVPLGSTTTTSKTAGTATGGGGVGTATGGGGGGTGTASGGGTAGPMADILFLAEFLADEFGLTFNDPMDELDFFFAVADLYFQVMHQPHSGPAAGSGGVTAVAK